MKFICVFCGSSDIGAVKYQAVCDALGKLIVEAGFGLVYGGGNCGIMNVIAQSVLSAGGRVIGVITPEIKAMHVYRNDIELIIEDTYSLRKARMAKLASAFIAAPGGFGTLDELFEIAISNQFASYESDHTNPVKPIALLNHANFYGPTIQQLKNCLEDQFINQKHFDMLYFNDDPGLIIDYIKQFKAPKKDPTRWWEMPASPEISPTIFSPGLTSKR
jgi:uncharacterized protein (TIGR00730 family)